MLGVRGVAPPSTPPVVLKRAIRTSDTVFFSLLLENQFHKAKLSLFLVPNHAQLLPGRNGFRLFAQKKKQGLSLGSVELEKEAECLEEGFEFDEIDDEFDYEDEYFDDEEGDDDEDDDLMLPFAQMDAWLKNKPRGFGEGKVYDTSIEDKLLEEIEQSRKSQLANLNKLKNESKEAQPKREAKKELKASEVVSSEILVRINNLPKKKNVQRDLKSAFQGVSGIVNMSPAVSGSKKTRDPVCKGFGFVDFKSLEDANRFVQMFSGHSIVFGKIQKQIKCEILKSSNDGHRGSVEDGHSSTSEPRFAASESEVDQDPDIGDNDPLMQFWEDDDFDEFDEDFDDEDGVGDFKLLTASEQGDEDGMELELDPEPDSLSLKRKEKAEGEQKKSVPRSKPDRIAQLSISASSIRLKVREKAELSEVFSRCGVKDALASTEIPMASEEGGDQELNSKEHDPSLQLREDEEFVEDDEEFDDEDDVEDIQLVRASFVHNEKNKCAAKKSKVKEKPKKIPTIGVPAVAKAASDPSSSPKQKEKKAKAPKQRSVAKEKASKVPKLKVPGSAKRLKGQDKAKLADVFTKYGAKEALASKGKQLLIM